MLNQKTIAVVVPAYNEETQIGHVIETMPDFVDRIVIINDCSRDRTADVVRGYFHSEFNRSCPLPAKAVRQEFNEYEGVEQLLAEKNARDERFYPEINVETPFPDSRIVLINHVCNSGKGAGIITGYKYCRDLAVDCTGSMDGDGQMDPAELESLCLPVISEDADYVKGNRLMHPGALLAIPPVRCFGNAILSILTKIASGYWHVTDTQTGYAVIGRKALELIEIHRIYRKYGYPNDVLVKLNIAGCSVKDVRIKPVYHVGEHSKMKIRKVIPRISWLLLRLFFVRLYKKYFWRSFHPLFLFYHFAFLMLLGSIPYGIKVGSAMIKGAAISTLPVMAFMFLFITGFQFLFFAMWMDIQDNESLHK